MSTVRARFIADAGWSTFDSAIHHFAQRDRILAESLAQDEVVLWFEHDLYDQLQLLQLLDWYAQHALGDMRLTMICDAEYLDGRREVRDGR